MLIPFQPNGPVTHPPSTPAAPQAERAAPPVAPTDASASAAQIPPDVALANRSGGVRSRLTLDQADPLEVAPWSPPDEAPTASIYRELGRAVDGPGELFNMMSKKHLEDVRGEYAEPASQGVRYEMVDTDDGPRAKVTGFDDIPNPDGVPWDPTQYAPHYVFEAQEDAFPLRPDFDGDADTGNNAGSSLQETATDHYRDGVVDGRQGLNAAFVVQQKGEYTVLTYSNYYATNKGANFHKNDYSTAQVYLKPNEQGKLEPEYLATSWHYGTVLTPWKDVQKDGQGHPIVGVGLGTHSLQPFGVDDSVPQAGLHLQGDGSVTLDGHPTQQTLTYDAFQANVSNATYVSDPESDRAIARRRTLGYGLAAADPLHPSIFGRGETKAQVEARLKDDYEAVDEHGGSLEDSAKATLFETARKLGIDPEKATEKSTLDKIKGFFGL